MRKALALAAIAAVTLGAAGGADAAVKKPKPLPPSHPVSVTDASGDANGINGQGLTNAVPSQSGPGERTAADITKVFIDRTDDKKAVTGFHVAMTLGAAPDKTTIYRVAATVSGCTTFFIEYIVDATGATTAQIYSVCDSKTVRTPLPLTKVTGPVIDWNIPLKSMPVAAKVGLELTAIKPQTKAYFGNETQARLTAPEFDETTAIASYKIGQ